MPKMYTGIAAAAAAILAVASANAQAPLKVGVVMSFSGQFADPGAQIDNGIKLYMKQNGDTVAGPQDRADPQGQRRGRARRVQAPVAGSDRARRGGNPRRLRSHPECARRRRRVGAGEEIHGQHERRHLGDHHQVALHGAHLVHGVPAQRGARHLGLQERAAQGLHARLRLRSGPRRRSRLPQGLQGCRRRDHRPGALPGRQPRLHRLPAARQGRQPGRHLHLGAGRPAAGSDRQGDRRARHRQGQDQGHGPGRADLRGRAQEHGRRRPRPHHRVPLRLQSPIGEEQGVRRPPTMPSSSAIPTCSPPAATTACTCSTRR